MFQGCFYKGNSSSQKLNELVLRLRLVEIVTGYILHVIHVAGTRMKRAGIDSFSRGDLLDVMMNSQNPLEFIPQNESADERSGGQVFSWITYWCKYRTGAAWVGRALKNLAPDDWFQLHTQDNPRLCTPSPAAMETVLKLFNEDRLSYPNIPHVFSIPSGKTHLWRKQ